MKILALVFWAGVIWGCSPRLDPDYPNEKKTVGAFVPSFAVSDTLIQGTPLTKSFQGVAYSWKPNILVEGTLFRIENIPAWASFDSQSGRLFGVPDRSGVHKGIVVVAFAGEVVNMIGPFDLEVLGDPLVREQWHLKNTGTQTAYNDLGALGNYGISLNLDKTIGQGIKGEGIKILISDDGLDTLHPDLRENILIGESKDYLSPHPWRVLPGGRRLNNSSTGTRIAGIIASQGWNGIGGRGIAPKVRIAGNNYTSSAISDRTPYTVDQAGGNFDIFNYSYSEKVPGRPPQSMSKALRTQLKSGFLGLRSGKGAIYVKAAGDGYDVCDSSRLPGVSLYDFGGVCAPHDANLDSAAGTPYQIVVGSVSASGIKTQSAAIGANIWVSAPSAGRGKGGTLAPGILTTERSGRSGDVGKTKFDNNLFSNNPDYHYTNSYGGTGAATAMVSGAVALILSANPGLTSRDIKYILAKTSVQVDSEQKETSHPGGLKVPGYFYELGWVVNGAGYHFNNRYGFGLVNVDAAVREALNYSKDLGDWKENTYSRSIAYPIPDNTGVGISDSLTVPSADGLIIEGIEVIPTFSHARPGELGFEIVSPSGTRSIVLAPNNIMLLAERDNQLPVWKAAVKLDLPLVSNAFYGESSSGVWTLRVVDGLGKELGNYKEESSKTGRLVGWRLNIYGHRP